MGSCLLIFYRHTTLLYSCCKILFRAFSSSMAGTLFALAGGATAWVLSIFNGQSPLQSSLNLQNDHVMGELGPRLSPAAAIHLPGSEGFTIATDRWVPWNNPHFDIVVEVATEDDVTETVGWTLL